MAGGKKGAPAKGNQNSKYLSVTLGEDSYAISILRVKEIIEYNHVTPVPMMPDFIRGAINLRGNVIPIVDLARRLEVGETNINRWTCVVIVEVQAGESCLEVGLTVDTVNRVWDVAPEDREGAPNFGGRLRADFIEGIAKVDEESFIILLDIDRMLSMEDLEQVKAVRQQKSGATEATEWEGSESGPSGGG